MSQLFASIWGSVAFAAVLARNFVDDGGVSQTWGVAVVCLCVFGAIGFVTGHFANRLVAPSERTLRLSTTKEHV